MNEFGTESEVKTRMSCINHPPYETKCTDFVPFPADAFFRQEGFPGTEGFSAWAGEGATESSASLESTVVRSTVAESIFFLTRRGCMGVTLRDVAGDDREEFGRLSLALVICSYRVSLELAILLARERHVSGTCA